MRTYFHTVDLPRWPALLILVLVLVSGQAIAASITLSWTPPTLNTDQTPLTDLDGYKIYYGQASGDYPNVIDNIPANVASYVVDDLTDGELYYFVATAYNTAGNESGFSNEASKVAASPSVITPEPPSTLTAEDMAVFTIIKRNDRFVLVVVGSVLLGTACDPTQSVNGHYVVPNNKVTWATATGPRPIVVVAQCG